MDRFDRRTFLQAASAAGVTAAGLRFPRPSAAAERPGRKFTMNLSCGSIGVRADPREAIRLARRFGFESVEPSPQFLAGLSGDQLQELRAELKTGGLVWGAAGLPVDFRRDDDRFKSGLAKLPELARALRRAGVTRLGTWVSPGHASLPYEVNFKQHAARLREVARVLGDAGQRFGLEYVGPKTSWGKSPHPFIHDMAGMKKLIAAIGRPGVGFVLDSWHWYTAGETEADLLSLKNEDVIACDLNDAPAGVPVDEQIDSRRELPCATGVIPLKAFLGALVKIGYDGPIRAEPFNQKLNAMDNEQAMAATAGAMKKAFALVG